MKAIVYARYGAPDVLELQEVAKPTPKDNEIVVKVKATTVTLVDCAFRQGTPFVARLYTGLLRPKKGVLGTELSGEVESVGGDVTRFKVGDQIFAATDGFDAHAEFICLPEDGAVEFKPSNLSFEESAAICNGALTALPFLRDQANLQRGQKILINGASGSIGTFAVQLAKYFGAHVTGVCSGANVELVKSLGADQVIDYSQDDFTRNTQAYDVIFDTVGKSSFSRCKGALIGKGIYLSTVMALGTMMQMVWTSMVGGKRAKFAATGLRSASDQAKDLKFLKTLLEDGKIKPVIDKTYELADMAVAHLYVETGHKKGNVVITMGLMGDV
ncbi:MAG: NAD(P)-dependent alcohol dehydrogenase [Magnetovibrio sp.]|nr:NAD(P)-dependent alcohol dehydrogenase [Magnetovibrio sp.]